MIIDALGLTTILAEKIRTMSIGEIWLLSLIFMFILWWNPALFIRFRSKKNSIKNMSNEKFKQHISPYIDFSSINEKDLNETLTATKDIFHKYFDTVYIMPLGKRIISWIINMHIIKILYPYAGISLHIIGLTATIIFTCIIFMIVATFVNMVISLTTIENIKKLMGMQ